MPPPTIPQRVSISDTFTGCLLQVNEQQLVALHPLKGAAMFASGDLVIRYGLRFLGKPFLSIVPGLVAIDYGTMMNGEEAWEFLLRRSNMYPRAEVFGYRNDGKDEMMYVKQLDLALPVEVLVYTDAASTVPAARPIALIANHVGDQAHTIPPRLLEYLPCFESIDQWQAENPA